MAARKFLIALATLAFTCLSASATFVITGNPANDNFSTYGTSGPSLGVGNYVRSNATLGGVFSYTNYAREFQLSPVNPLTTMTTTWLPGDRILMLGGVMTPGVTANSLGWSSNPANSTINPATQRVVAKFGVNVTTSLTPANNNTMSPSSVAPPSGNGNGSFTGNSGGYGAIQVSIGATNMVSGNANQLLTPIEGPTGSNVAQFFGTGASGGMGFSNQGLNLYNAANQYDVARYMFTVDGSGNLASWEIFLNTTYISERYVSPFFGVNPSAVVYGTVPTGGGRWIGTFQNNNGNAIFTDGLVQTDLYSVPAPPALVLFGLGTLGLGVIRRVRR